MEKSLKQSVSVRWNSVLRRLISVQEAWDQLLLKLSASRDLHHLQGIDRNLLMQLIDLLKDFKAASDGLETDQHVTLHKVLYYITLVEKKLKPGNDDHVIEQVSAV